MGKRILFLIMMAILAASAFAQPTTITWQGKLLDASGNAITQHNVAMNFAIFDASAAGNQLWALAAGEGDIYYDKNTHKARCYDGSAWHDLW
jgi:hypothetical protein